MLYRSANTSTHLPLQYRQASFAAQTAKDDGTVDLTWTTGAGVMRYDWRTGSEYLETLSVKEGHVHLEQLNKGAPVLDTHSGWTSLDVRGVVLKAWLEPGGVGAATVRFDLQDPKAADLFRKVKEGFVKGVSVGYEVHEYEETFVEGKLTQRLAISWTPRELSICPMGADHGGEVRGQVASDDKRPKTPCKLTRAKAPTTKTQRRAAPPAKETPMKGLLKKRSITAAKARELAKAWITLVDGDETKTDTLALEISSFMSGEEAGEGAAEETADPGEMAAVDEAAREVTGLDARAPAAKVVAGLYRLEMRATGKAEATRQSGALSTAARAQKIKAACDEGKLTPAEAKLVARRLAEGKLTDEDLDEELALAPKVGPGAAVVEPPAPKGPDEVPPVARTATPAAGTPDDKAWEKVVTPEMRSYCEARGLPLEIYAKSWLETQGTRKYEKPSDRKN